MSQNPRTWQEQIDELIVSDPGEAVAECLSRSQRLGDSSDPASRGEAADVLWTCASRLGSRGSTDFAVRVAEELRSRLGGDPSLKVQVRVVQALSLIGEIQAHRGQVAAALSRFDEALALVAATRVLTDRGSGVSLLMVKARVLSREERREESIVLLDAALSAIEAATAGNTALRTRQAAVAVVSKLDDLCALDRYAEARDLGQQLSDVLSGVLGEAATRQEAEAPVSSESSLAAALAEIFNDGECWGVFAAKTHISPSEAAQRAVSLYSVSDPWAPSASATEPVTVATAIIRSVADGYALLSREWPPAERASLPLPQPAELDQLIRQQGVDEWASAAGHPLNRHGDPAGPAASPTPTRDTGAFVISASGARDIAKCLYMYELTHILSESDAGLEALRYKTFLEISVSYLRSMRDWSRTPLRDQAPGVVIACWLIAEGFFAITHRQAGSTPVFAPAKDQLRQLLHETAGYAWLLDQSMLPPAWTDPEEV